MKQVIRVIDVQGIEQSGYDIRPDGSLISRKFSKERVIRGAVNNCGYKVYNLSIDGKTTLYLSHRLVAEKYLDKVDGKVYINHIDGNKLNNHLSNLEWCSMPENINHALKNKLLDRKNGQFYSSSHGTNETCVEIVAH